MSDADVIVRPRRRWPLYASLFLNVVLLTALALGAWRVAQFRNAMADGGMGMWLPRQIERSLPEGAREKVRTIRDAHAPTLRPLFQAARQARDAVRMAVEAEPFDAAQLRAAVLAMRDADSAVAAETGEMMIEIATVLTPDERRQVRQALRDRRPGRAGRGPGERGGPDGPPPPPGP